jgi:hypothetical protein
MLLTFFLKEQYNMVISSQALGTPKEGSETT